MLSFKKRRNKKCNFSTESVRSRLISVLCMRKYKILIIQIHHVQEVESVDKALNFGRCCLSCTAFMFFFKLSLNAVFLLPLNLVSLLEMEPFSV